MVEMEPANHVCGTHTAPLLLIRQLMKEPRARKCERVFLTRTLSLAHHLAHIYAACARVRLARRRDLQLGDKASEVNRRRLLLLVHEGAWRG